MPKIYRAKLVQTFAFQPVRHESGIFRFECIKACRHDLSRHVESARRNMNIEDQISHPLWVVIKCPAPGKIKFIKFLPGSKRHQMPGVCPGSPPSGLTLIHAYSKRQTIKMWRCEDYLHQVNNTRHRIALTKLRLSNHKLAIETGHYSRPLKKPAERTCPICKLEMEDEYHFICKYMPCLPGKTMFVTRLFGKRIWNKNKQNVI